MCWLFDPYFNSSISGNRLTVILGLSITYGLHLPISLSQWQNHNFLLRASAYEIMIAYWAPPKELSFHKPFSNLINHQTLSLNLSMKALSYTHHWTRSGKNPRPFGAWAWAVSARPPFPSRMIMNPLWPLPPFTKVKYPCSVCQHTQQWIVNDFQPRSLGIDVAFKVMNNFQTIILSLHLSNILIVKSPFYTLL